MKSTKNKKKTIQYGKVDVLSEDEFDPKNAKFRVTMFIPLDVLDEVRKRAKEKDLPYQTYINQILRNTVLGSDEEEKIRRIVREELGKAS